jgi:hypothetical protein
VKRLIAALPIFFVAANLLAQDVSPSASPNYSPSAEDAAAVAAATAGIFGVWGACCFVYILMILACLAGWIFSAIWVMNDAKARNSENAQLVTVLTWIPPTWWVGLIVHLATRPKGNLVPCPNCQKKRLEGSAICPHCGQP